LYGSEIWGMKLYKDCPIEKVHLKFLKKILHVRFNTPTSFVYGELGRFPLCITVHFNMLKYWHKIVTNKKSVIVRKCYDKLYDDVNIGKANWASCIRDILQNLGLNHYWLSQCNGQTDIFLHECNTRLHDQYIQKWLGDVSNVKKNRLYVNIKSVF